jgi:hypothetical protein
MVSFTPQPPYPSRKTARGTIWTGDRIGPKAGLDAVQKRIILPGLGLNPGPPARIPSLSRLTVHEPLPKPVVGNWTFPCTVQALLTPRWKLSGQRSLPPHLLAHAGLSVPSNPVIQVTRIRDVSGRPTLQAAAMLPSFRESNAPTFPLKQPGFATRTLASYITCAWLPVCLSVRMKQPGARIVALGSTQLLAQMSTRNLPGGKGRLAHKADNLTAI